MRKNAPGDPGQFIGAQSRGHCGAAASVRLRSELHRRALHRFGDGLRVTEVVLLSLRIGPNIPRRHQSGLVAKLLEAAAEMVRADAGLHPDQTRRHILEPCFHLTPRPLLPQHDGARFIETDDVKGVLSDIDADDGD
jgi:hypothetical protein